MPWPPSFPPGSNMLAIAASNSGSTANPAGLHRELVLTYADGTHTNIQMDATWKAANTLQTDWNLPGFNDSAWANALGARQLRDQSLGNGRDRATGLPIFRRQFTVNPGLQRAVIYICGLGQYELSANGVKVGNAAAGSRLEQIRPDLSLRHPGPDFRI